MRYCFWVAFVVSSASVLGATPIVPEYPASPVSSTATAAVPIVTVPSAVMAGEPADCHCCEDEWVGPHIEDWKHWFPEPHDYCASCSGGASFASGGTATSSLGEHEPHCSLCGGGSECHTEEQENVCHLACSNWECNPHLDPENPNCEPETLMADPSAEVTALMGGMMGAPSYASEVTTWVLAGLVETHPGMIYNADRSRLQLLSCKGNVVAQWFVPRAARPLLAQTMRGLYGPHSAAIADE